MLRKYWCYGHAWFAGGQFIIWVGWVSRGNWQIHLYSGRSNKVPFLRLATFTTSSAFSLEWLLPALL